MEEKSSYRPHLQEKKNEDLFFDNLVGLDALEPAYWLAGGRCRGVAQRHHRDADH